MINEALVKEIGKNISLILPAEISLDELALKLGIYFNELIQKDFQQLITVLYRIDVSENKLKQLLKENPEQNTGKIIAEMVIERQLQKIKTRRQFGQAGDHFPEEEKW